MAGQLGAGGFEPRTSPPERRDFFDLRRQITEILTRLGLVEAGVASNTAAIQETAAAAVATAQTTASTSYTDLATAGPAVTLVTGSTALVRLSSLVNNGTTGNTCLMGVAVSGATTLAASDALAAWHYESSSANSDGMSGEILLTGLTPGSNTFTAKYRVNGDTGTWTYRVISVTAL